MRNTLTDMHNILMESLERLSECEDTVQLADECKRAHAITQVASAANANVANMLKVQQMKDERVTTEPMPKMLG